MYLERSNPTVQFLLSKTFPDYRGKTIRVETVQPGTSMSLSNYWDGGTRSYYVAVNLDTGATSVPQLETNDPFHPAAHRDFALPDNVVLAEHTIFCGKDIGITFHIPTTRMVGLLPDGQAPLSREEKIALEATAYKSSYNGIRDYRCYEATRRGLTAEQYYSTKASLIDKGLLTKAGALTTKGKNAR